jgi:hypothetical protein
MFSFSEVSRLFFTTWSGTLTMFGTVGRLVLIEGDGDWKVAPRRTAGASFIFGQGFKAKMLEFAGDSRATPTSAADVSFIFELGSEGDPKATRSLRTSLPVQQESGLGEATPSTVVTSPGAKPETTGDSRATPKESAEAAEGIKTGM